MATSSSWWRVDGQKGVDDVMRRFGDFHDAVLREAHLWTEHWVGDNLSMAIGLGLDTRIRMLFQRQWRPVSAIELLFEEVERLNLVPSPENYEASIFSATFFHREGVFYWAEEEKWLPGEVDSDSVSWIAARKLHWRDASDWMGESLHYAVGTPPIPSA